jgi:hypothetical protein
LAHRTLSGAPGQAPFEQATLGNSEARSAIIHQTIWCASGATAPYAPTDDCVESTVVNSAAHKSEHRSQRSPDCPMWHRTVRCSKTTRRSNGQWLQILTDALTWRAPNSGCPVRHRTVRCAHRQQTSPTARKWVGAINNPQPPHSKPSKHSEFLIHCKSKVQHSNTQSKQSIHSKFPKSTLVLKGL